MEYLKAFFKRLYQIIIHYPIAAALTVLIVVFAVFMLATGRTIQIGGLLGKIWGKKPIQNSREIVPEDRKDEAGKPIPVGESDKEGFVQAPAVEIKPPGIFSNPNTVKIVEPNGKEKEIQLPVGIKNSSVKEVTVIKPNIVEIKHNDKSGIDVTKLIEILESK